jgi:hypothetical protein
MQEFNDKVKTSIPVHELSLFPRIGDVEGQSFECGCGDSHIMNFEQHFLSLICIYLKEFFFLQIADI